MKKILLLSGRVVLLLLLLLLFCEMLLCVLFLLFSEIHGNGMFPGFFHHNQQQLQPAAAAGWTMLAGFIITFDAAFLCFFLKKRGEGTLFCHPKLTTFNTKSTHPTAV